MVIKHICILAAVIAVLAFSVINSSMAEEQSSILEDDHLIIETVPTADDDGYVTPTLENLSRLYWSIGKLDIDNDEHINNYLVINECELYLRYFHNDFEWKKIQDATRDHILKTMGKFYTTVEILSPIYLERYNSEKEYFELTEDSKIVGTRRLDFAQNIRAHKELCTVTGNIDGYPDNMIIILSRPFVLEKVPVKRELAQLYLEDAKRFYESLPPRLQMQRYERMAFLRLKVKVTQYKNTITVIRGEKRAVVFGQLEGYEIYADQDKMKPLYSKDTTGIRFKRLRRIPETAMVEEETGIPEKQEN